MAKKRVTNHNGRVSKKTGKPYNPKHNDRNFDKENAENILPSPKRENENHQWVDDLGEEGKTKLFEMLHIDKDKLTNEEAESLFYQIYYKQWLDDQNRKHIESRHTERIKNMDQVRENKNYCPEEEILKIGKMTDEQVAPDVYKSCVDEYISFLQKEYGEHLHILDWNTHSDEAGGMHTHIRWVWDYTDENGMKRIGQDKALEKLGFTLPIEPGTILKDEDGNDIKDKPIPLKTKKSRFNNRKIPFTAKNRAKWLDICEAHGIEVEREPDKEAVRGQELYEMNQANKSIEKENERLAEANKSLKTEEKDISGRVDKLMKREKDLQQSVKTLETQVLEQMKKKKPGEKEEEPEILTSQEINNIKTEPFAFGMSSKILVEGEDWKKTKNTALRMNKTVQSLVEPLQAKIRELMQTVKDLKRKLEQKDGIISQRDKDIELLNRRITIIEEHSSKDSIRANNYQAYMDYCRALCEQNGISVPGIDAFLKGSSSRDRNQSL